MNTQSSLSPELWRLHKKNADRWRTLNEKLDQLIQLNKELDISQLSPQDLNSLYEEQFASHIDSVSLVHDLTISDKISKSRITSDEDTRSENEEASKVRNVIKALENMIETRKSLLNLALIHGPLMSLSYKTDTSSPSEEALRQLILQRKDVSSKINQLENPKASSTHNILGQLKFTPNDSIAEELVGTSEANKKLLDTVTKQLQQLRQLEASKTQTRLLALESLYRDDIDSETKEARTELEQKIRSEEMNLKRAKVRTSVLSEFISALVASSGINWADNETVREIVLFCGQQYVRDDEDGDGPGVKKSESSGSDTESLLLDESDDDDDDDEGQSELEGDEKHETEENSEGEDE